MPAAATALSFLLRDSAGRGGILWALYPVIDVVMGLVLGFIAVVTLIGIAVEVLLGALLLWQRLL